MIDKKTLKGIKKGDYSALIGAIEFLLDSYNEDKFDQGYRSCLSDLSVRSQRLAEEILKTYKKEGIKDCDLGKVIEDYYKKALKE